MDVIKQLISIAPWAVPVLPIVLIFYYYTKIRNEFESKQISVQSLKDLLEKVSIHLPDTVFVKLENDKTSVKMCDILKDRDSDILLKVILRQDDLENRIDVITKPAFGTCLCMFVVFLLGLTYILHPGGSLLGVFVSIAVLLSMVAFILLYHWDGQVKSDMEILKNHVKKTPPVKK